jgi:hypothetical protein
VPEACCVRVGGEAVDCTGAPTPGSAYLEGCYALLAPSAVPALTLSLVVVSLFQVQAQQGDKNLMILAL